MNQLYIYIYLLFFGSPSHLGHYRALSRVPRAVQEVLIIYFIRSINSVYVAQSDLSSAWLTWHVAPEVGAVPSWAWKFVFFFLDRATGHVGS